MHHDPWEPPDGPYPADPKPDPDSNDAGTPNDGEITRISSSLLNWHVIEIEGQATLIEEVEIPDEQFRESSFGSANISSSIPATSRASRSELMARPSATAPFSTSTLAAIRDQYDDIVVATMPVRQIVVMPGETATLEVNIGNQGRWSALFEISLEGWLDETWTPDLPMRVHLEPGARQVVTLPLVLPRQADCRAGDHALAVVVRAARYPGHLARLAATLVVERYAALKVGVPQPRELQISWFSPAATLRLPITNQGNYPATIHLQGVDRQRQCDFTFYTSGNGLDDGIVGAAQLLLEPGQTVVVPVEVRTRQRALIGFSAQITPFRLVARVETEPPLRRAVDGQLACSALIGPWHMAISAVLGIVAIFGLGLAGLALLVALRSSFANAPATPIVAAPADAVPVVALVIQMDQPMPTRVPVASLPSEALVTVPQAGQAAPVGANVPSGEAPVVSANQVTAPGEPTPMGQAPLRPLLSNPGDTNPIITNPGMVTAPQTESIPQVAPAPIANSNLTYGQMFKDVAMRYDLDWRLLAAQAYLESGFDSLAMSGQGDMGLMQIRPGTWNEFAPAVEASDPFDSYSNVLVGAVYLDYLREQLNEKGQTRQEWMLVAFNWGPDKVFSHLEAGGTWESLDPARRQYAEDILQIAASIPPS
jgi:membrane-bound lytic murein transglycosylase F